MLANDLIHREWTTFKDWYKMRGDSRFEENLRFTERDFDNFVEIIFRQIAEALGVKYNNIKAILYGKNIQFFEEKARIFSESSDITELSDECKKLKTILCVPDINFKQEIDYLRNYLDDFNDLKVEDKIAVLEYFQKVNIKVNGNGETLDVRKFLTFFSELNKLEKCKALKQIFNVELDTSFLEEDTPVISIT